MTQQEAPPLFSNSNSSTQSSFDEKGFDVVHGHKPIPAWPKCPSCGRPSSTGQLTCGQPRCVQATCGPTCCKPTCDEPAHRRAACERADKAFDCVGIALFKVSYAIEVTFRAIDLHPPAGSPIAETTLAQAEEVLAKLMKLYASASAFRHDIRERGGL